MEKRRFYNFGDAKGFTKQSFFEAVRALATGEDVDAATVDLVAAAAEYELDGIANKPASKTSGEKKDPLQSEYAVALRSAILPFVTKTPQTAKQLIDQATAAGLVSPKGKDFSAPWVARVLNAEPTVMNPKIIVDGVDAKGLKRQSEVTGYKLGTPAEVEAKKADLAAKAELAAAA